MSKSYTYKEADEMLQNNIIDKAKEILFLAQQMDGDTAMEIKKYIFTRNPEDFADEIMKCATDIQTVATTLKNLRKDHAEDNGEEYEPYEFSVNEEELEKEKAADSDQTTTLGTDND